MLSMKALPQETVSRITSGQIITSAFSVVKELVENSLDGGASSIEIRLDNFGLDKVEVKDDGCGLSKDEMILMISKEHYTSKINAFQDLTNGNLCTYGFRGEAVNAICTVAEVKITSKKVNDLTATVMKCDNKGEPLDVSSIAANNGTTVTATDLFKKLPVRRNYMLKGNRKNEDLKKIEHLTKSFAMIMPGLRISLFHNNKMIFLKAASQILSESITKVVEVPSSVLCPLSFAVGNASIDLWIPKYDENKKDLPLTTEDNGQFKVYLFMNRRPVSDKKLEKVMRKYLLLASSYKLTDNQLVSIMCIETAKNEIDVNLDPNKNSVFLVKHMEISVACEEKLKEYYNCSIEDIEKKRLAIPNNSVNNSSNTSLDDNNSLAKHNQSDGVLNSNPGDVSPFGDDNSFGASLDNDFEKLYKSKQQHAIPNPSSSEAKDNANQSKEFSIEDVTAHSNQRKSDLNDINVEKSWARGNILQGDNAKIISPVAHYKQPKISAFSSEKEDWKHDSNSFVQPEKRAKLDSDNEKENCPQENPRINDKTKKREGAGNKTMEDLARGPESTPEMSRAKWDPKMFRNVTPVQFDMRSVTRHIQRKVEETEKKKTDSGGRRNRTEQDGPPKVLGQLNPSGYWVCSIKNGVHIINHHKLQEVVLYKRLLQSNALPCSQFAGHPLEIFEGKQAWDTRLTSTLVGLAPQQKPGTSTRVRKITDQRFVLNGFDIRIENDTDRALLFGVCSSVISFMGITDVHEILREIMRNPDVSIEDCRPEKVKTYLKGEAVRLERQTPPSVDRGQMERLLNVMIRHDLDVCLHSKQLKSNNLLKHENKRQKNMLDSLAPYYEKRISSLNQPNSAGTEAERQRNRHPSYENPNAVKGTDGVIYRAAGPRGKGAKTSTIPIVAPTVVKPGCVTTATLPPPPKLEKEEEPNLKKELEKQINNVKTEVSTPARGNNAGGNNDQLLAEIRAKFPNAGPNVMRTPPNHNNNVMTQVEKKMTKNNWEKPPLGPLKEEPLVKSPESQVKTRLLYDPKPRRGRPIDLPDQTMILKTPKAENATPKAMNGNWRNFTPNFN